MCGYSFIARARRCGNACRRRDSNRDDAMPGSSAAHFPRHGRAPAVVAARRTAVALGPLRRLHELQPPGAAAARRGQPARLRTLPGRAPVVLPSCQTIAPLTITASMPFAAWMGFWNVA